MPGGGGILRVLGIIYLVKTARRCREERREERRRQEGDAAEDS